MNNEEVVDITSGFNNLDVKELTDFQLSIVASTASNMQIAAEREIWDRERMGKGDHHVK